MNLLLYYVHNLNSDDEYHLYLNLMVNQLSEETYLIIRLRHKLNCLLLFIINNYYYV